MSLGDVRSLMETFPLDFNEISEYFGTLRPKAEIEYFYAKVHERCHRILNSDRVMFQDILSCTYLLPKLYERDFFLQVLAKTCLPDDLDVCCGIEGSLWSELVFCRDRDSQENKDWVHTIPNNECFFQVNRGRFSWFIRKIRVHCVDAVTVTPELSVSMPIESGYFFNAHPWESS